MEGLLKDCFAFHYCDVVTVLIIPAITHHNQGEIPAKINNLRSKFATKMLCQGLLPFHQLWHTPL
jgi:hypothetical protein